MNNFDYAYDSAISSDGQRNIDILVGNLSDNSSKELEVIVGIQEGDPLITLDRDVPSVCRDRFVLGDYV